MNLLQTFLLICCLCYLSVTYADGTKQSCEVTLTKEISVCLPKNWQPIPQKEVIKYKAQVKELTGHEPDMNYVFQEIYDEWFVFPYIIINSNKNVALSRELKKNPEKFMKGLKKSSVKIKNSQALIGQPVYSDTDEIIWVRVDNKNIDGDETVGISGIHIETQGVISVLAYDVKQNIHASENSLINAIKSVKYR